MLSGKHLGVEAWVLEIDRAKAEKKTVGSFYVNPLPARRTVEVRRWVAGKESSLGVSNPGCIN